MQAISGGRSAPQDAIGKCPIMGGRLVALRVVRDTAYCSLPGLVGQYLGSPRFRHVIYL